MTAKSPKNDIDTIINNLSQSNYTFGENLLSKDDILQIKNQAKDARGRYGLNAPIGTNIFSFLEQKGDIVFQLQDFKDSELDAMIIKYSAQSQKKYIIINSDKPLINQIFAAGHEFYHYLYSFIGNSQDTIVCTFSKNDKEEIKANRFTAEFLLPEEALKDELNSFIKFMDGKFVDAPLARRIIFCFYLMTKYSLPLKAVMYRLKEEHISDDDYLLNHYDEVKQLLLDYSKTDSHVEELYSKENEYLTEQLYSLVPYLYNKGRLDDIRVAEIVKQFSLSEKQILEALVKDE